MFVLGSSSTCMINFGVLVKTALLGLPCFAGIQALVDIADKISSCIIFLQNKVNLSTWSNIYKISNVSWFTRKQFLKI